MPQFGLLFHFSSLRLSSEHSDLVLTLSTNDAVRASLSSPRSLVAEASIWASSPLGVEVSHIFCSTFPSQLGCPLRFQNYPQTCLWEGFLLFGNFFMTPSPGWVSIPNSCVSLFLMFYILSYLILKRIGCLSGCLVSSASIQKLFCESCSAFKLSFDEFVGKKVVSPFYSSTVLGVHGIFNQYVWNHPLNMMKIIKLCLWRHYMSKTWKENFSVLQLWLMM